MAQDSLFGSDFLGLGPSLLEKKAAEVQAKLTAKQEAADPVGTAQRQAEYAATMQALAQAKQLDDQRHVGDAAGTATVQDYIARQQAEWEDAIAKAPRTSAEMGNDFRQALKQGTASVASGIAALTAKNTGAISLTNPANLMAYLTNPAYRKMQGQVNAAGNKMGDAILRKTAEKNAEWQGQKGLVSQFDEAAYEREVAAKEAEHAAQREQMIRDGIWSPLAKNTEFWQNVASGGLGYLDHPTAFSNAVVGQLPTLVGGVYARGATALELAGSRGAAQIAERAALKGITKQEAKAALVDELSNKHIIASTMAMEGGGAYDQAATAILQADPTELAKLYPDHAKALLDPTTADAARSALANDSGSVALLVQSLAAGATAKLGAQFEKNPLNIPLKGNAAAKAGEHGLVGRYKHALTGIAGETGEEFIQSGTGQLAANLGNYAAGNDQQDLMQGVGTAAGQGAVTSAGLSGAMATPGLLIHTGWEGVKGAGRALLNQGGKVLDKVTQASKKQAEATAQKTAEVADTLSTSVREAAPVLTPEQQAQASVLNQPAEQDSLLTPEAKKTIGLQEGGNLDRIQALSRAINTLADPKTPAESRGALSMFVLKTQRELGGLGQQLVDSHNSAMEAGDTEKAQHLLSIYEHVAGLMNHGVMQEIQNTAQQIDPAVLDEHLKTIQEAPADMQEADPKVQHSIDFLKEVAYQSPGSLPKSAAETLMARKVGISDADRKQLQLALDFNKIENQAEAAKANLEKEYGPQMSQRVKDSMGVRADIETRGFSLGNGKVLPSLAQHVDMISQAMSMGQIGKAAILIKEMGAFVAGMRGKALAHDAAATAQLKSGSKERQQVDYSKTLKANGLLSAEKNSWVNIHQAGSRATLDAMHVDANTLIQSYNMLLSHYPVLAKQTGVLSAMQEVGMPKWQSTDTSVENKTETQAKAADSAPAPTPSSGQEQQTKTGSLNKFVKDQQEIAKKLSDEKLNEHYNKLYDNKNRNKMQDAVLKILEAEMTAREDAAVAKQKAEEEANSTAQKETAHAPVPAPVPASAPTAPAQSARPSERTSAAPAPAVASASADVSKPEGKPAAKAGPTATGSVQSEAAAPSQQEADSAGLTSSNPNAPETISQPALDSAQPAQNQAPAPEGNSGLTSEEEAQRQALLAQAQRIADGGTNPDNVDFVHSPQVSQEELQTVLEMSDQEYLDAVQGDNKDTSDRTSSHLVDELAGMQVPDRAIQVGEHDGVTLMADGDTLYAYDKKAGEVVGILMAKTNGTEFAVAPSYRGKGLGKRMMRELMLRDPLAPSGGMSNAAKNTRLAVLHDLQAESQVTVDQATDGIDPAMTNRFGKLYHKVAAGIDGLNQFLRGFRINKNSGSLFSRFAAPSRELSNAVLAANDGDVSKLKALLPKHYYAKIESKHVTALSEIFGSVIPRIEDTMKRLLQHNLNSRGATGTKKMSHLQRWIADFNAGKGIYWSMEDQKTLHLLQPQNEGKEAGYHPTILRGMSLAGMNWAMNWSNRPPVFEEEKLAELFPDGISEDARQMFAQYHYFQMPAQMLGQEIKDVLGLSINKKTPRDVSEGILNAMSLELIQGMHEAGVLAVHSIEAMVGDPENGGGKRTLYFLDFAQEDDRGRKGELTQLSEKLDGGSLFSNLVNPDSRDLPKVGAAFEEVPTQVRGTNTKLSREQQQIIKTHQNTPAHLNKPLLKLLLQIEPVIRAVQGYTQLEPNIEYNAEHLLTLKGKNNGIDAAWRNLRSIASEVMGFAQANQMEPDQVPIHHAWDVITNGRMMQNGPGGQASKLLRQVFTSAHATLDLSNERHVTELKLAVAQALGVKVEQKLHKASIAEMEDLLSTDAAKSVLEDLLALDQEDDNNLSLDEEMSARLQTNLLAMGINTELAVHALQTYARWQHADKAFRDQTGPKEFKQALSFELDGKTDGPINALVHMGLHTFSEKILNQLRQGGYIINNDEKTTLNDWGKELGDLYGSAAAYLQENAAIRGSQLNPNSAAYAAFKAGGDMLVLLKYAKTELTKDGERLVIDRKTAKHGVMAVDYGSGDRSILRQLVGDFLEQFYEEVNSALQEGRQISEGYKEILRALTNDPLAELDNKSVYSKLRISPSQIERMVSALQGTKKSPGFGSLLTQGIRADMEPVLRSFDLMYKASALQSFNAGRLYKKLYDAKRAELLSQGKIQHQNGLSPEQEAEILAQIQDQLPIYKTMLAQGNGEGVDVSERAFTGELMLGKKPVRNTPLSGKMSLGIRARQFLNPGVRAAPLYNIALGDATMMGLLFKNNPGMYLNVFDGLEVPVGQIGTVGNQINEAVWKGWQFNPLTQVYNSFSKMNFDLNSLSEEEATDLLSSMKIDVDKLKDAPKTELATMILEVKNSLRDLGLRSDAVKKAIRDHHVAVDHMSGGYSPYLHERPIVDNIVPSIARAATRYYAENQYAAQALEQADKKPNSGTEGKILGSKDVLRLFGLVPESSTDAAPSGVRSLSGVRLVQAIQSLAYSSRVNQFIANSLIKVLPDSVEVYAGTKSAIEHAVLREGSRLEEDDRAITMFMPDGTVKIFLKDATEETFVHELVHAATYGVLRKFYRGEQDSLTPEQRKAAQELEDLTGAFLDLEMPNLSAVQQQVFNDVRQKIQDLLNENRVEQAVNEYMAYALSNPVMQGALAQAKAPGFLEGLATKLLGALRRLLGLPNNQQVVSFLEATLGNTRILVQHPIAEQKAYTLESLFHSLGGNSEQLSSHDHHMEDLLRKITRLQQAINVTGRTSAEIAANNEARILGDQVMNEFLDAGFNMTPREQLAFSALQAILASSAQLDPGAMTVLEQLYNAAMPQLGTNDFLDDPTNDAPNDDEVAAAHRRLSALRNYRVDTQGRSNLLANFMALALTHEPLRKKLSQITLPSTKVDKGSLDGFARSLANKVFDKLGQATLKYRENDSQANILDVLMQRLVTAQEALAAQQTPQDTQQSLLQKMLQLPAALDAYGRQGLAYVGEQAGTRARALNAKPDMTTLDKWLTGMLNLTQGLATKEGAAAYAESLLDMLDHEKVPTVVRDVVGEVIGGVDSTRPMTRLLTMSKDVVSKVRQRLREEGPAMVQKLFQAKLPEHTWKMMHRAVAKVDLQALLNHFSGAQMSRLYLDQAYRAEQIAKLEDRLAGTHQASWIQESKHLAEWLVNGTNNSVMLHRNANALAHLTGFGSRVLPKVASQAEPFLDRLVTLYAIDKLSQEEQETVGKLLVDEAPAMHGLLTLMRTLTQKEQGKLGSGKQHLNAWKGYVPVSMDTRGDLVLAGPVKGAELLRRGYTMVASYVGDGADGLHGLAYYATAQDQGKLTFAVGGKPTYTQGAMQTVEHTVRGVDQITGQTLDPSVRSYISEPGQVAQIAQMKRLGSRSSNGLNLMPVYNSKGEVIAWERPMDRSLLEQHLRVDKDLSKSMGLWLGRQAEETMARVVNAKVIETLKADWDRAEKEGKQSQYVAINRDKDPVNRDRWGSVPRETQDALLAAFDGYVMVRRTMLNNSFGYRQASVADVFTGMTGLPKAVQENLEKVAYGLLQSKAFPILVNTERLVQGLVSHAKNWIVVRSGKVGLLNMMSNVWQLAGHGVPLHKIPGMMLRALQETNQYVKNEHRLAQLSVLIDSATSLPKRSAYQQEAQRIRDNNSRMRIFPLIQAGELPTIAEGLTEHSANTALGDLESYVSKKLDKMPRWMSTAAKYAVVAEDTALYQGLNRMVQYGDFLAKATLFEHMTQAKKVDQRKALDVINETFINYSMLAGRSRDYLESMGMTWFLNYKLRIQKIVLRSLRENPFSFLMAAGTAGSSFGDSLWDSSAPNVYWKNAFGPGQFYRAHEMLFWEQLF